MAKKRQNKVRVAFKKNRGRRSRSSDLARQLRDDEETVDDLARDERLSGKGDLSRHRTVIASEGGGDQLVRQIDGTLCRTGRVLSAVGLNSLVQDVAGGRHYECTVRRVVRTMSRDHRSAVVTGDEVLFRLEGDDHQGVIERVNPRRSVLSRQTHNREHVIVSNVDQVLIMGSVADPQFKPNLIDRFLISAEKGGVKAIVCINKSDLAAPADLQPVLGMYGRLGYEVLLASAHDGQGIDRLRALLKDKNTVVSGQSGVGKSSLLNRLQPGFGLSTEQVSNWTRKGRHTTRRAVMLPLEFGGWVADTPGIRQFDLWDVIREEVEGYFVEFRPFVTRCRFPDCSHTHEQDCGIKSAVARKLISRLRYESYLRIVNNE